MYLFEYVENRVKGEWCKGWREKEGLKLFHGLKFNGILLFEIWTFIIEMKLFFLLKTWKLRDIVPDCGLESVSDEYIWLWKANIIEVLLPKMRKITIFCWCYCIDILETVKWYCTSPHQQEINREEGKLHQKCYFQSLKASHTIFLYGTLWLIYCEWV